MVELLACVWACGDWYIHICTCLTPGQCATEVARAWKNRILGFVMNRILWYKTLGVHVAGKHTVHCCLLIQTARHHCYVFAIQTLTDWCLACGTSAGWKWERLAWEDMAALDKKLVLTLWRVRGERRSRKTWILFLYFMCCIKPYKPAIYWGRGIYQECIRRACNSNMNEWMNF